MEISAKDIVRIEGRLKALGVAVGRIKATADTAVTEPAQQEETNVFSSGGGGQFARGAWCITALKSGYTLSTTDNKLWDGQFDNQANRSYRVYKGALTRFGEICHNYDAPDLFVRHKLIFENHGSPFNASLEVRLISGSWGATVITRGLCKFNGTHTTISSNPQTITLAVKHGTNVLTIFSPDSREIDTYVQLLDGHKVVGVDFDCGKIKSSGGGGGGQGQSGGTT